MAKIFDHAILCKRSQWKDLLATESCGVSKRQFSKMLGEDESNVYRYFRDGYDPKLSTLKKWASKLKMKINELVRELLDE